MSQSFGSAASTFHIRSDPSKAPVRTGGQGSGFSSKRFGGFWLLSDGGSSALFALAPSDALLPTAGSGSRDGTKQAAYKNVGGESCRIL